MNCSLCCLWWVQNLWSFEDYHVMYMALSLPLSNNVHSVLKLGSLKYLAWMMIMLTGIDSRGLRSYTRAKGINLAILLRQCPGSVFPTGYALRADGGWRDPKMSVSEVFHIASSIADFRGMNRMNVALMPLGLACHGCYWLLFIPNYTTCTWCKEYTRYFTLSTNSKWRGADAISLGSKY